MKTIRVPTMTKFNRSINFYGKDFPIHFYRKSGCFSMYRANSRHYWFGIKHVGGVRFSVEW